MQPDKVDVTVSRQMAVLQALAVTYQAHSAYEVVLAGFNYSDEVCSYYLNNLHQFERRKNRIQNTLTLANSTATAIMSAASVSKEAVIYVTQALGFSTAWVGIVADSYLYRLSPGILAGIVDSLHEAYRAEVAGNRYQIDSYQMAYQKIRDYYSLCLPVTLESKIEEYLADAKAGVKSPGANVTGVALSQGVRYTRAGVPVVTPR